MNKRSIEPLHVVALWEGEQHLIGQNGNGEKEHSTDCNRQGECAQPQPGKEETPFVSVVHLFMFSLKHHSVDERLQWP